MSCKCPSRFTELVYWIMKAPFINIPILVIGTLLFWELLSQQDVYYMFIPVGFYAQLAEYFMLLVVAYFSYREFKQRNRVVNECNQIQHALREFPYIRFLLNTFLFLMVGYFIYYFLLLYTQKFNLHSTYKKYEVTVTSYSMRGRRHCKPLIETDLLNKLSLNNETFFYKMQKKFLFSDMCGEGKVFEKGQIMMLDIMQTPFGLYVYDLKPKIY